MAMEHPGLKLPVQAMAHPAMIMMITMTSLLMLAMLLQATLMDRLLGNLFNQVQIMEFLKLNL
jgi:cell division protein FtsX